MVTVAADVFLVLYVDSCGWNVALLTSLQIFHTDLKDLKDCYAASGYAVILAIWLAIRGADGL